MITSCELTWCIQPNCLGLTWSHWANHMIAPGSVWYQTIIKHTNGRTLNIILVTYINWNRAADLQHMSPHKFPDSKVHGANMESTWVLSTPAGPHVGHVNLAIRIVNLKCFDTTAQFYYYSCFFTHCSSKIMLRSCALWCFVVVCIDSSCN